MNKDYNDMPQELRDYIKALWTDAKVRRHLEGDYIADILCSSIHLGLTVLGYGSGINMAQFITSLNN